MMSERHTMTDSSSSYLDDWWIGLSLWYNDQDYLGAMRIWERAIESLSWWEEEADDNHPFLWVPSIQRAVDQRRKEDSSTSSRQEELSPLLLFLAGCYLDAGEFQKARKALVRCMACVDTASSSLYTSAIRECLACVEEDKTCHESLKQARDIVQYALQNHEQTVVWTNAWQRPGYLHPHLASKPVYDEHPAPWCQGLEQHWNVIRDELIELLSVHWPAVGSGAHRDGAGAHDGSVVAGDWREIVLAGAGARPELAPKTYRILNEYCKDALELANAGGGEIIFSRLGPNTHIRPHCGTTNLRLTAHLGLVVPPDKCRIRVADQWLEWREGKVLVFDDSYEHEVVNEASTIRVVLLLRFWHPALKERSVALDRALQAKQEDLLQRCNPPVPGDCYKAVVERGMERTRCPECWRQGYTAIRLEEEPTRMFRCDCGARIF
jgi:aspartyl/asparaginyl beta-hydroxylase (cupin superfamily)